MDTQATMSRGSTGDARARRRLGRGARSWRTPHATRLLVAALLLLHLAPIWAFDYFPSQDGPAHLHNAKVLQEYDRADRSAYREYYAVDIRAIPNLLGHALLAGMMAAVPPRTAERILLSLCVLLLPVSILYALRALRPEPSFAWALPFPLIYNFPLHMGFYSFSLGVPLSFLAVGYVLAHPEGLDLRRAARLAPLLVLVYFAHLLALLLALIAVAIVVVWRIHHAVADSRDARSAAARSVGDALRANGFMPLLAAMPAAILAASHFLRGHLLAWVATVGSLSALCAAAALAAALADRGGRSPPRWMRATLGSPLVLPLAAGTPALLVLALVESGATFLGSVSPGPGLTMRMRTIWGIDALVSFAPGEAALAVGAVALMLAVALYASVAAIRRRRPPDGRDGTGWIALAFVALYLVAPHGVAGGGYVLPRIALYALLAAVLWVGGRRPPASLRHAVRWGAVAIAVAFLGVRAKAYGAFDRQLAAYVSAAAPVVENTTLLGLSYSPYGEAEDGITPSVRVKPLLHAAGYVAARKGLVLLNNYEATTSAFPVRYRPGLDPTAHVGNVLAPRGRVLNLLAYPQRTGGRIDYVLVWGVRDDELPGPAAAAALFQLERAYARLDSAPASAPVRLYRRRRR